MVLRTVIGNANQKNRGAYLHFNRPRPEEMRPDVINLDLNKLMQNVGAEQFDYGTFKAAYDTDPRIKTMVANFNERGIEPKTNKSSSDIGGDARSGSSSSVSTMAKRAVDLKDL